MEIVYKEFKELKNDQIFRARNKWWKKSAWTNEAYRFDINKIANTHCRAISTFGAFEYVGLLIKEK